MNTPCGPGGIAFPLTDLLKEVFLARPKCQTKTLISSSRPQISAGRVAKSDVARTMSFRERKKSRPPRRKSDVDGENSICDVKKSCPADANYRSSRPKSAWSAANSFLLCRNEGHDADKSARGSDKSSAPAGYSRAKVPISEPPRRMSEQVLLKSSGCSGITRHEMEKESLRRLISSTPLTLS